MTFPVVLSLVINVIAILSMGFLLNYGYIEGGLLVAFIAILLQLQIIVGQLESR